MDRLLRTQLVVSFCALALSAETYLVAGIPPSATELGLLFFATLLIYNIAQLRLDITRFIEGRMKLSLTGDRMNIIISATAFICAVALLGRVNSGGYLMFAITSLIALAYVMPFTYKGETIKGLRGVPVLKNILLSFVWALGTISIPMACHPEFLTGSEAYWMFARRFLFVYSLTVIFDIRDEKSDSQSGIWTLPMGMGIRSTKILAISALLVFIMVSHFDPHISHIALPHYKTSLIFSALATALLVTVADSHKKNSYYIVVVDGAMILQFFIVAGFALL